ncbi:UNVERIFIED_CONTAM: hypothetical protein RMT77_015549 [Armadillidium vulgare]
MPEVKIDFLFICLLSFAFFIFMVNGQTFQYSKGWVNGKRSNRGIEKSDFLWRDHNFPNIAITPTAIKGEAAILNFSKKLAEEGRKIFPIGGQRLHKSQFWGRDLSKDISQILERNLREFISRTTPEINNLVSLQN